MLPNKSDKNAIPPSTTHITLQPKVMESLNYASTSPVSMKKGSTSPMRNLYFPLRYVLYEEYTALEISSCLICAIIFVFLDNYSTYMIVFFVRKQKILLFYLS